MNTNLFYIYAYYDPREPEQPFYIGKGTGGRMYEHFRPSYLARDTMFYNKLRKMLAQNIRPDIKVLHDDLDEETAFELEGELIAQYGRRDLGTGCLCNHTDGGEGRSGAVCTDETRKRLSVAGVGREFTLDHRIKMSKAHSGPRKVAANAKNSATKTEKYGVAVQAVNPGTGEVCREFPSIAAAARAGYDRSGIQRVLKGQNRLSGGYIWRYG